MNYKYLLACVAICGSMALSAQTLLIDEDFSGATDSVTLAGWTVNNLNSNPQTWWFGYNPRNYDVNSPMSGDIALFDQNEWLFDAVFTDAVIESPTFDASGSGTITLTFDHYFRSGGFGSSYAVEVFNGTVWDTVTWADTSTSPNPPSGTYTTLSESHDITSLSGGATNAQVRFRYTAPVFTGVYWIVDNVQVQESGCPPPSSLGASNITTSAANLSWTAGGAADFNVEYGPMGFSPGTGTMINTTSPTASLSGLSPNTTYDFYVRDSCSVGMVSNWVGPQSFTTLCTPFTAPYSQGFDNGVVQPDMPDCWSSLVESGGIASYASTFGTGSNYTSAPNAVIFYYGPGSNPSDFIGVVSPEFSDLGSNLNRVRFQARTADGSSIVVGTMSDPTDSSTFLTASVVPAGMNSFGSVSVDLTNVPQGHDYVAIKHGNQTQGYVQIDDFVYEAIPCQKSAGIGSFATVCGSDTAVNLLNYLQGASPGGVFIDNDNTAALSDSLFDASTVAPGVSYQFTYLVSQTGCPDDSARVTINVEAPITAGADVADTTCALNNVDLSSLLDASAQAGGSWIDVSSTGALSGPVFNVSQVARGNQYVFEYVVSGISCTDDTASISLYVADAANAGSDASETVCDSAMVDLTSFLSANAQPNGSWLDIDGTGALSGSDFDATQVSANNIYQFAYVVSTAECGNDTANFTVLVQDCDMSLNKFGERNFSVYPNPASDRLFIEPGKVTHRNIQLKITSSSGQVLMNTIIEAQERMEIDLSGLARGVYHLELDQSEMHRILVQ